MFEREDLVNFLIKITLIVALILLGFVFFFTEDYRTNGLGLIFGTLAGVLSFKLIESTGKKAVTMDPDAAYKYTIKHYFLRYIIYFIVLLVAILADYLSFPFAAVGLVLIKFVIVIYTFLDTFIKKGKKNR